MNWLGNFVGSWFGPTAEAPADEIHATGHAGASGQVQVHTFAALRSAGLAAASGAASAGVRGNVSQRDSGGLAFLLRPRARILRALHADGTCGATGQVHAGVLAHLSAAGACAASGRARAAIVSRMVVIGQATSSGRTRAGSLSAIRARGRAAAVGRAAPGVQRGEDAEIIAFIVAIDTDRRKAA